MLPAKRKCRLCQLVKLSREFRVNRSHPSAYLCTLCKACEAAQSRQWRNKNMEKVKKSNTGSWRKATLRRLGISEQDFQTMRIAQNGVCAICGGGPVGRNKVLSIDHCHTTGRVRGLLCGRCNVGLGQFNDCSYLLDKASAYLKKNEL